MVPIGYLLSLVYYLISNIKIYKVYFTNRASQLLLLRLFWFKEKCTVSLNKYFTFVLNNAELTKFYSLIFYEIPAFKVRFY